MFEKRFIELPEDIWEKVEILVFENDEKYTTLLNEFFKDLKASYKLLSSEEEFLKFLESHGNSHFELIVCAFKGEPEKDLFLLEKIKKSFPESKILGEVEYMKKVPLERYFLQGADDIIFKPFSLGEFKARLTRLLYEYFLIERIKKFVIEDPLTGVYNRRFFEEEIRKETYRAIRQRYPLVLFMIDLDNFKWYNDNLGHQAGDELLKKVGNILKHSTREKVDKVCRYGGDEFVVILPHITWKNSLSVVERIFKNWKEANIERASLSIGIAQMIERENLEKTVSDLIKRADEAMYKAKQKKGLSFEVDEETQKIFQ